MEKTNERFQRYLKTDGPLTTDGRSNKGDYYGPHRVNPRSKIAWIILLYLVKKGRNARLTQSPRLPLPDPLVTFCKKGARLLVIFFQ